MLRKTFPLKRGEGMIRDRGNIKWNAMMLPEHVKKLREWKEKDEYEEKPELDEWALQDLSEQLQMAFDNQYEIELNLWKNHKNEKVSGVIAKMDPEKGNIIFEDGRRISFCMIYGMTIFE